MNRSIPHNAYHFMIQKILILPEKFLFSHTEMMEYLIHYGFTHPFPCEFQ